MILEGEMDVMAVQDDINEQIRRLTNAQVIIPVVYQQLGHMDFVSVGALLGALGCRGRCALKEAQQRHWVGEWAKRKCVSVGAGLHQGGFLLRSAHTAVTPFACAHMRGS
jgi:hypothetical protein